MRLKKIGLGLSAQIFKALSDESRLRILHLIWKNERMCISDLELILDFTQTKVSRHLIYLKNARILKVNKIDQWAFYSIRNEVLDVLEQFLEVMDHDTQIRKDLEDYMTLESNRELAICKPKVKRFLERL